MDLRGVRDTMELQNIVGFSVPLGPRYDTVDAMRSMLSGFDVLLNSSLTEGACLPVIEAESVGCPVVINNATATSELLGPYGVACNPAMSMIGPDGTQCALPSVQMLTEGLEIAYEEWKSKKVNRTVLSNWVKERYDWDHVYDTYWRPVLSETPKLLSLNIQPKLVLGCGMKPKTNAVNHDLSKHSDFVDIAHDLEVFPYPWEDEAFNTIECEDVIEHLDCNVIDFMNECWRILKPDGLMMICTVEHDSWQHRTDPTHKRGFTLNSFDYFDNRTILGNNYGHAYTDKRWNILRKGTTPTGELLFVFKKVL